MINCSRPSRTGLFEIFGSVLIEGDCYTPNREHFFLMAILPTSEAAKQYIELHSPHTYISEVRGPANYIERYKKWETIKFKKWLPQNSP
jgi:hypothetical protein